MFPTATRRTGAAIVAAAVAICIGIIATTTTPTGGRTPADAATPSTTTTTTVPEVGHLADERDLERLVEHADAIEERWGEITRWVAAVEEAEARRAEVERQEREEAERRAEAERAARVEAARQAQEAAAAPAPTAPEPTAPAPAPAQAPPPRPTTGPADSIAGAHGISVTYADSGTPCGSLAGSGVYGCTWTGAPSTIWLSTSALDPSMAGLAADVARHEVAHVLIQRSCGRHAPPITAGRHEQVTDAFAHLYLGAGSSAGGYGYTAQDAAAARAIQAGRCT